MRLAWIGVVSGGVLAATTFASQSAIAGDSVSALLEAPMLQLCQVSCRNCFTSNSHEVLASPTGESVGTWHQDCLGGHCASTHPPCPSPSFAALDDADKRDVWKALTGGDDGEIADVIREHGAYIELNAERQMIQILDCGRDHVIANIPIPSHLASRLGAVAE